MTRYADSDYASERLAGTDPSLCCEADGAGADWGCALTPAQLAALTPKEREAWAMCEAATPGPWVDMTSAGPDVGAFDGEIRSAQSFTHICSDPDCDDRPNDRAFIANARTALPAALETIANLRADLATEQARHTRAWVALCVIGEALDKAGHPTLIPERALRVGEAVDALLAERDALRAELANLRGSFESSMAQLERTTWGAVNLQSKLNTANRKLSAANKEIERLRADLAAQPATEKP